MTLMNHSTNQYENINRKMNKSTSATYNNNNKVLINNYLFNTPQQQQQQQQHQSSTVTLTIPSTGITQSSSYRVIPSNNNNNNNSNTYSQQQQSFANKRALFNGVNNNNTNSTTSSKYFQTIQDAAAKQNDNHNRLHHSNSVESLINNNNNINTDNSLQSSSSTAFGTQYSNGVSQRKSAFQVLKPRATTLNSQQQQQHHDFQTLTTANSNNSLNTMNNLQQNNREFSEKIYAYKTKIATNPTVTAPKSSTPPVAIPQQPTRYSYSSKKLSNSQYDNFDPSAASTATSSAVYFINNEVIAPPITAPVNDLLFINNYNFDYVDGNSANPVNNNSNNYSLTNGVGNATGMLNGNHDDDTSKLNNDEYELSMTNFEQKLYNTTVNNSNNMTTISSSAFNSTTTPSSILMNSLQFFSHFDVQSILFNYNDMKLKKDSLHTSLNIRTGASAASRQGSMENLNKIAVTSMSSLPAAAVVAAAVANDQNYITRVNNQYFNGGLKNETISNSSSSSPRPSLTNTQSSSSSSSSTNGVVTQQQPDSIKNLLTADSNSFLLMNDLVENCPCFKVEIGGDTFKGLGLVKESQRRFMKLNSISLLDKTAHFKKELVDLIEANFNEPFAIEFQDYGAFFYRHYFFSQDHVNYLGIDKDIGPVAISIKRDKLIFIDNNQHQSEHVYRFIMRTSELHTLRGTISEDHIPTKQSSNSKGLSHKEIISYLIPQLDTNCLKVADTKANEKLLQLDESHIIKNFKVGVILCKAGQTTEEEMYNNRDSTPAFDEFMSLLGDKVGLKGFNHYKGGLDTKTDTTGTHSIYTKFRDKEIMFHVSTLLPFTINDKQQLTRKRHIGNDVVTIVFQEPGSPPFSPKSIRSHFQHIFIIVRVYNPNSPNIYYSVAVSYSKDIPAFGPPLPKHPRFTKSQEFREFLLAKIINADNAGLKCEKFTQMRMRARNGVLKDLALNYVTKTNLDSSHRFGLFNFGSIKQKKLRSKSLQIFSSSETNQLSGGIFWPVDIEDYKYAFNCYFGISKQSVVAVDVIRKCVIFAVPCNSIIGWSVKDDDNNFVLYYDQGECISVHVKSKLDLQQMLKRLEYFTRGCKTTEIIIEKKDNSHLGFSIHYDGVVTEVEPYSLAYYRGLKQGTRIVKIGDTFARLLSHEKMIDILRKTVFLKLIVIPSFDDGTPRRGQDDCFSLYSYLSTCSSNMTYNERPIDIVSNTSSSTSSQQQQQQFTSLSTQRHLHKVNSNNNNTTTVATINPAFTNSVYGNYAGYESSYPSTAKLISHLTINPASTGVLQQPGFIVNGVMSNKEAFKNSTTSMNRLVNEPPPLQLQQQQDVEFYNQQAKISPPHNNPATKSNSNLQWTKLIQTATKEFENVHRSSDSLYYSDLHHNNHEDAAAPLVLNNHRMPNNTYTDAIVELKENLMRIQIELDQEKLEKQKFKSKISYLMDENSTLKQELVKIKDENKVLSKKFNEFLSSTTNNTTNTSFSLLNQSNVTNI